MAKCEKCDEEMSKSKGCLISKVIIQGKAYERIKVGSEYDFYENIEDKNLRCHDCGATVGHYHHYGCDEEQCPICHNQLITCMCNYKEDELEAQREKMIKYAIENGYEIM